ncbi:hypothetical protein FRX31_022266, partial [Thalictrum thalictroides]
MMPNYSLRKQLNIVIATCALHNYIRRHTLEDEMFKKYENDELIVKGEGGNNMANQASTSGHR